MPNPINPDDYNIDKLNTGFLGPILTTDFRNYILGFNLDEINPEVVSHGYNLGGLGDYVGNEFNPNPTVQDLPDAYTMSDTPVPILGNITPWESNQIMNLWSSSEPYKYDIDGNIIQTSPSQNKSAYTVQPTTPLTNPGSVSLWGTGTGQVSSIGTMTSMVNLSTYGPEVIKDYTNLQNQQGTGYIQYKTFAGGDFRSTILGQQLGFGSGAGIEFDSKLADIGKEQRKFNIKERIKLNFIGDTIGKINADPLGLLAGQDLFTRDYTITQGPGFGGKAFEFTQSLLGFNFPSSILPSWMSTPGLDGDDVNDDLLNNTASGTKSLLYDAIVKNKWGPRFRSGELKSEPDTKVGKFFKNLNDKLDSFNGAGEQPSTIRYTDPVTTDVKAQETREKSLVDKLNDKVAKAVDSVMQKVNPITVPTEGEFPTAEKDPTQGTSSLGYNVNENDVTYVDEYKADDDFNKNNLAKQYNQRFKAIQSTSSDEVELTSDKNNLFWKSGNPNKAKRGLLKYTQNLIDSNIDNSLSSARYIGITNDNSNISTDPDHKDKHIKFSQGNRIRTADDKVYCRSWSVRNPYSRYSDTIRHEQLVKKEFQRLSVLEDNGMPKIVPYPDDYEFSSENPSRYMLSLENLAWQNQRELHALPNCEKGPNGGRIMWFPPYDISFTDNTSVNWESTQFIGRGEPIYTYNTTERTGTLSFTIITDHPSSLNQLREDTKANLERYFAGCDDLSKTIFGDINGEEIPEPPYDPVPKPIDPPTGPTPTLEFYYENADTTGEFAPGRNPYTDIDAGYEMTGLNSTFLADLKTMSDFLLTPTGKRYKIISEGFTSALNVTSYNKVLGKDRAKALQKYLLDYIVGQETGDVPVPNFSEGNTKSYPKEIQWLNDPKRWAPPVSRGESPDSGPTGPWGTEGLNGTQADKESVINDPKAKKGRKATIRLEYNPDIDAMMLEQSTNQVEETNKQRKAEYNRKKEDITKAAEELSRQMVNECTYFNKIKVEDSFIYDSIKEKIKYFHPAFHSMTPEGLNSRLTFLQQCTRQGPNINRNEPQNMAFGKPPICVLRIGDFYHTKIVIDSINFTYEPLLWDLNPEGIGVQPMITKVDLNFKFIGGSSLGGPITELQNAVSFNFFANTSVYNKRKSVTVTKDGKNLYDKPWDYGSYITPGQKPGPLDVLEVDLSKKDEPVKDVTTNNDAVTDTDKTDPKQQEINKKIEEIENVDEEMEKTSGLSFYVKYADTDTPDLSLGYSDRRKVYNLKKPNGKWVVFELEDENGGLNKSSSAGGKTETISILTSLNDTFGLSYGCSGVTSVECISGDSKYVEGKTFIFQVEVTYPDFTTKEVLSQTFTT